MRDKIERVIEIGDTVAYATKQYRSPVMKIGVVDSTSEVSITVITEGNASPARLTVSERVLILPGSLVDWQP